MPIPDYQSLMLPLLKIAGDGEEHGLREVTNTLAQQFELSEAERTELLPSGTQARFDNRATWARLYLTRALLLEATGRAKFRITDRGLDVLRSGRSSIDARFLRTFPEFVEWQNRSRTPEGGEGEPKTPAEILESSYQSLRRELAQELLERIKKCSSHFFEELVVDLLVAMGYGGSRQDAGQAIGRSGDGGIDGIIKEDKLGLDAVYIQAKRWEATVGRPVVQAFAGSLMMQKARKGVLVTTSQFSKDSIDYVSMIAEKIVLIDGEQLAQLMIDHNVGITEVASYVIKKVDSDYFGEE